MATALLLMLVSGLFLSAWVSLMSTRAAQMGWLETAVQRRLSVENSRQFAWQCAHEKAFDPEADLAANQAFAIGANKGGLYTDDGWNNLNIYKSTRTPGALTNVFPYNYTGLRASNSYYSTERLARPSSLTAVDDFNVFLFLKSYPPTLAGDLVVSYLKPEGATSELDIHSTTTAHNAFWIVEGRTVIRRPDSLFAITTPSPLQLPSRSRSLYIQTHDSYNSRAIFGTDLSGNKMLPSNLNAVPSTTGPVSNKPADRFTGVLNVIKNDLNPDNSLWHFMDREKNAGRSNYATIDVFTESASATGPYWMVEYSGTDDDKPKHQPPNYPSGYSNQFKTLYIQMDHPNLPHFRITNVVNQIVFVGQTTPAKFEAAGQMSPIMITIIQDDNEPVGNIAFEGENNRRLILAAKHPRGQKLDCFWVGEPLSGNEQRWRMTFINEYQAMWLELPRNVTYNVKIIGGLMTNWFFKRYAKSGTRLDRLTFVSDASVPTGTAAGPSYASLLPRDAWLESYFFPVPPTTTP